jgi:hypothetical protein
MHYSDVGYIERRRSEGATHLQIARERGVTERTIYRWLALPESERPDPDPDHSSRSLTQHFEDHVHAAGARRGILFPASELAGFANAAPGLAEVIRLSSTPPANPRAASTAGDAILRKLLTTIEGVTDAVIANLTRFGMTPSPFVLAVSAALKTLLDAPVVPAA